jgi:endoglucanase
MKQTIRALSILVATAATLSLAATPVEQHGRLSVDGPKIVDSTGSPVQLRGMSMFWSMWMPKYWNARAVKWMADDWKISLIRAAVGVENAGGWLLDTTSNATRLHEVVQAAVDNGIYVVIDWHDHTASQHPEEARAFFERAARRYGHLPNVIYEIWNEPVKVSWGDTVKPYAESIIASIRDIDPDNLILVGTPNWCQDVDSAAADPIKATNVAYTLHFYSGTHKTSYRDRARKAVAAGLPLFVSEWGTSKSSGTGTLDFVETNKWLGFLDSNHISWANWSVADKEETSAALKPNASRYGGWSTDVLSESGNWVRALLRTQAGFPTVPPPIDTFDVPGRIPGSKALVRTGLELEPSSDSGAGENLGWIEPGDWAEWRIRVAQAGAWRVRARVASAKDSSTAVLRAGTTVIGGFRIPNTSDLQVWTTIDTTVTLPAGTSTLRVSFATSEGATSELANLNWLEFYQAGTAVQPRAARVSRVQGMLRLESASGRWTLRLRGLDGRVLRTAEGTGAVAELDLRGLTPGVAAFEFRDGASASTGSLLLP